MKTVLFVVLFNLFLLVLPLSSCKNSGNKNQEQTISDGPVSVDVYEQKLNAATDAQVVDVRTPEEYGSGHLLNAMNIDWNGEDFAQKTAALDKNKPTFIYCKSGRRSREAGIQMKKDGFKEVYEMEGGLGAWKKAGKGGLTPVPGEEIKDLSKADYDLLLNSDKMVLVDFNAPWCKPCIQMDPILDEVEKEQKDHLKLIRINYDENEKLIEALGVEHLPTLILYKNNREVWRYEKYIDKIGIMVAIASAK
jgi:thioredoxin 1